MEETSTLARLLAQVRRRAVTQLLLQQGNYALIAAFAALILLLLFGTQVMNWYWPVLLALVALAVGVWRMRGRVPDEYQVAQMVDQRMGLYDTLSTAVFFERDAHEERAAPELVATQRNLAETTALSTDAVAAVPLAMPRGMWVSVAMLALCGALLIARYGVRGSLDLRQPLMGLPFDSLFGTPVDVAKAKIPQKPKRAEDFDGVATPAEGKEEADADRKAMPEAEQFKIQTAPSEEGGQKAGEKSDNANEGEPQGQEAGEPGEKGDSKAGGDDRSQSENSGKGAGQQNAKSPSTGKQGDQNNSQQTGENSSLMDKMKDAMANMLARMKMSPQGGDSQKKSMSNQQGSPQSAGAQKQAGQKGAPSPGKQSSEGQSQSEEAGEQQGEGASKNMNAQGKMSDGASEKQQASEGKSGAGKQDGEKDIKAAEQAAAMGKISELIGKRAQNLTGEVMVEVSSGKQRLKTDYVQRNASHADAGGDITRDEVPVQYQQFVQQYFEEVRKAPAAAAAKKPATK